MDPVLHVAIIVALAEVGLFHEKNLFEAAKTTAILKYTIFLSTHYLKLWSILKDITSVIRICELPTKMSFM